jgi:hypothetical protein
VIWLVLACTNAPDSGAVVDSPGDTDTGTTTVQSCSNERAAIGADTCAAEAACVWSGAMSRAYFGYAVASGADLDGDGRDDVLVGSPGHSVTHDEGAWFQAGWVGVISGAGVTAGELEPVASVAGWEDYGGLGRRVQVLPDFDGDGVGDMVASVVGDTRAGAEAGAVVLLQGASWSDGEIPVAATWLADGEGDFLGEGLAVGDVDGDGLTDVWVGGDHRAGSESWNAGAAYLILGGTTASDVPIGDVADAVVRGSGDRDGLGYAITLGDFDGDGSVDTAVGAPYASSRGAVYVLLTQPTGDGLAVDNADVILSGEATYDAFGWQLAASDLDGDGTHELAVGAPLNDQRDDAAGKVVVYTVAGGPEEAASWLGSWRDEQLGSGVTGGADFTGDGHDDLVLGGVGSYRGLVTRGGRATVVGGASWQALNQPIEDAQQRVHGESVKDYLGSASAMGDIDGDGSNDLILGGGLANVGTAYDIGKVYLFFGE